MDTKEILNLFDTGVTEPEKSFWYQLYCLNRRSVRRYIFGWPVLVYCRENGIGHDELPGRALEVFEGIHAKDEKWHGKNNFWVYFVASVEPNNPGRQVVDSDWHRSWRSVKMSTFTFPKIYQAN